MTVAAHLGRSKLSSFEGRYILETENWRPAQRWIPRPCCQRDTAPLTFAASTVLGVKTVRRSRCPLRARKMEHVPQHRAQRNTKNLDSNHEKNLNPDREKNPNPDRDKSDLNNEQPRANRD